MATSAPKEYVAQANKRGDGCHDLGSLAALLRALAQNADAEDKPDGQ